jgi:hypothetical protein
MNISSFSDAEVAIVTFTSASLYHDILLIYTVQYSIVIVPDINTVLY